MSNIIIKKCLKLYCLFGRFKITDFYTSTLIIEFTYSDFLLHESGNTYLLRRYVLCVMFCTMVDY